MRHKRIVIIWYDMQPGANLDLFKLNEFLYYTYKTVNLSCCNQWLFLEMLFSIFLFW